MEIDLKKVNIKKILKKIEKSKTIIATERDKLREVYDELGDCLESFDSGTESLEIAKQEIEQSIETLSQYI